MSGTDFRLPALARSNNLSELSDPQAARTNLAYVETLPFVNSEVTTAIARSQTAAPVVVIDFDSHQLELLSDNSRGNGFPSGGFQEIFDDRSVKFGISIYNQAFGTTLLSVAQLLSLQAAGFELYTHIPGDEVGTAGYTTYSTDATAEAYVRQRHALHTAYGFDVESANFLGGWGVSSNSESAGRGERWIRAVKKFYRSCSNAGVPGTATVSLLRKPCMQYLVDRNSMDEGLYNTWVDIVDLVKSLNRWAIFYGHPYTDAWYETKLDDDGVADAGGDYTWQKIGRLLDYCASEGVSVLTRREALNLWGNAIDVGSDRPTGDQRTKLHFRVSKQGHVSMPGQKHDILPGFDTYAASALPDDWPQQQLTSEYVSAASGFPSTGIGVVTTDCFDTGVSRLRWQYFVERITHGIWRRCETSAGDAWTAWHADIMSPPFVIHSENLGTINAGTEKEFIVAVPGVTWGVDIPIVNPLVTAGQPPAGLTWCAWCRTTDQVTIRVRNHTAGNIDWNSSWQVTVVQYK